MEEIKTEDVQFAQEMSKEDLLSFCVYTANDFDIIAHHEIIADNLKKLMDGEIQNLIISMPPRAGKSRIMQEFIAYLLGHNPNTDILYTGHTLGILEDFSYNIRGRINSAEYKDIFKTEIAKDSAAVKNWKTSKGGVFSIYGVGGGITGKGGDYLIIDDPYATRQDAESETVRRTVSNWYWSTFLSRMQDDKSKQIIIMQRWREDDLVGEILEAEKDKWTELIIPALNEKEESFWPGKFSSEFFIDKRNKNPLFFASQYQQEPFDEGSGDFIKEYFNYYEGKRDLTELDIISFIDPAISQKQSADNTAIVTIGIDSNTNLIYLLEVKKLKEQPDEIINQTFLTAESFMENGKSYKCGIEVVQYQKMLALEITKQMKLRNIFFHLEEVRPQGEKNARIKSTLQPRYSSGSIIHQKYGPNVSDLESELLKFPNSKHDDLCDALASAVAIYMESNSDFYMF